MADQDKERVFVITPKPETEEEKRRRQILEEATATLKGRLANATSLADFILAYRGVGSLLFGKCNWLFEYGPINALQIAAEFLSPGLTAEAQTNARAAEELRQRFTPKTQESGKIELALKRIRDKHGYYTYGVLARFPRGVRASRKVSSTISLDETCTDMIYFAPSSACVLHACDDLFKEHRGEVFSFDYKSREQAIRDLQTDDSGRNEYQLSRTEAEVIKQSAENYLLVGLHSAFSNEPNVFPVSEFWDKK